MRMALPAWLPRTLPYLAAVMLVLVPLNAARGLRMPVLELAIMGLTTAVLAASVLSAIQIAAAVAGRGRALPALTTSVTLHVAAFVACAALTAREPVAFHRGCFAAFLFFTWQGARLRALSILIVAAMLGSYFVEPARYGLPPRPFRAPEVARMEIASIAIVALALGWRGPRARLARMGVVPVEPIELALLPIALAALWTRARAWIGAPPFTDMADAAAIALFTLLSAAALLYLGSLATGAATRTLPASGGSNTLEPGSP